MIIDFHTHSFPERIAPRAIESLKQKINLEPVTDGTADDLIKKMKEWGIDISVICNIATNPKQQENVISYAIESDKTYDELKPLGSINPESDNIEADIDRISKAGLTGIKVHPDYMGHEIDDPVFDPIFELCSQRDLFVITHAGFDVCSPDHIHATPDMMLNVINRHPNLKLVAAHFGANCMWDEVLEKMCGSPIWIDTSLAYVEKHDRELLKKILLSHDPDRIVFGSDAPWCSPYENIKFIESFDLPSNLNEKIFELNAKKLLKI